MSLPVRIPRLDAWVFTSLVLVLSISLAQTPQSFAGPAQFDHALPDDGTCAAQASGDLVSQRPEARGLLTGGTRAVVVTPHGWYGGDLHVHGPDECFGVAPPAEIVAGMPGDLTVASVLLWGGGGFFEQNVADYFTGAVDPISTSNKIIKYDLEMSGFLMADRMGHIAGLGLTDIDFPQVGYLAPVQDWVHAQGGVVGSLHSQAWSSSYDEFPVLNFCCGPWELPISVLHDRVDFLDYQGSQDTRWRFIYYNLLNCGFRLGLAATSDAWCLNEIGDYRTYAKIDGPVTYDTFIQAVADGRTSTVELSHGFVDLTVGGSAKPGDQLDLAPGENVTLKAEVYLPADVNRVGTVKLVKNGVVLATRGYSQTGGVVTLELEDSPTQSSWYAARLDFGHTGAVYGIIDGAPIRVSAQAAQYFVDYFDFLRDAVLSNFFYQMTDEEEVEFIAQLDAAQIAYGVIRDEAAQTTAAGDLSAAPRTPRVRVWPVPFNRSLHVEVDAPGAGPVTLEIFGTDGRSLRSIRDLAGQAQSLVWDGRDLAGHEVPSGIYFYRVSTDDGTLGSGRLVRVR